MQNQLMNHLQMWRKFWPSISVVEASPGNTRNALGDLFQWPIIVLWALRDMVMNLMAHSFVAMLPLFNLLLIPFKLRVGSSFESRAAARLRGQTTKGFMALAEALVSPDATEEQKREIAANWADIVLVESGLVDPDDAS